MRPRGGLGRMPGGGGGLGPAGGKAVSGAATRQYRVVVSKDPGTGSVVAEVPALGIADHGPDAPEALANIKAMVTFHLACLQEEGKPVPASEDGGEGFYVHWGGKVFAGWWPFFLSSCWRGVPNLSWPLGDWGLPIRLSCAWVRRATRWKRP